MQDAPSWLIHLKPLQAIYHARTRNHDHLTPYILDKDVCCEMFAVCFRIDHVIISVHDTQNKIKPSVGSFFFPLKFTLGHKITK